MSRRGAITRIELLVLIVIVAAVAAGAAVFAMRMRRTAETTVQKANFAAIESALTAYFQDFGDYPRNSALPTWNTRPAGSDGPATPAPLFYSLAPALLGPGPAVTQSVQGELRMGDGVDGPGFRSQSIRVLSGTAAADSGDAKVTVTVDPADMAKAAEFAGGYSADKPAAVCFQPAPGQPFPESIGINSIALSGGKLSLSLMVAPMYSHDGPCEISRPDGKVWGPYLSPTAFKVAYIPAVDSFGYPFFGYGNAVLLDDWGQVIQYFPRDGPANNRAEDSTLSLDASAKAGPLYGYCQKKTIDKTNGQAAIWDWRDGAPFFTLAGQTAPAQDWPDPALGASRAFRPDLAIEWMLGAEPDSVGIFRDEIGAGETLKYDGPYILISAGPGGPERPNGGYCNFSDPANNNKSFSSNSLQQIFSASGNLFNFERK
jgi:type II secretory pathway pseudopilin PulG